MLLLIGIRNSVHLALTCQNNKFNSRSKDSPDVVIHTKICLAAKTHQQL